MDYNEMLDYGFFLAEQQYEDERLRNYIEGCVTLANGRNSIREMAYINETVGETVKGFFTKILNFIKSIWAKFVESLDRLIQNTQDYLTKYKDIILKKKAPDVTYTMYNYPEGLKTLVNAAVPPFNYETMKAYLDGEHQEKFLKQYSPFKDCLVPNSDATYPEQYKATFRNGKGKADEKIEIIASDLNMKDIYDYCYNYKSVKDKLQKDINTIDKASVDANNIIAKRQKDKTGQKLVDPEELKKDEEKTEGKTSDNGQGGTAGGKAPDSGQGGTGGGNPSANGQGGTGGVNPSANGQGGAGSVNASAAIYDRTSRFVNELKVTSNDGDGTPTQKVQDTSAQSSTFKANNTNIQQAEDGNKEQSDNALNTVTGEVDAIVKQINIYFDSAKELLGAKQTICEEIFKEYMAIIKYHVRYYVGHQDKNKSTENDRSEQRGSNYNQDQQTNNNQQQDNSGSKKK